MPIQTDTDDKYEPRGHCSLLGMVVSLYYCQNRREALDSPVCKRCQTRPLTFEEFICRGEGINLGGSIKLPSKAIDDYFNDFCQIYLGVTNGG